MMLSLDQIRDLLALGLENDLLVKIVTIFERDASRDGRDGKALAADRARKYRARQAQKKLGMAEPEGDTSRHADRHVTHHATDHVAPLTIYPFSLPLLVGEEETKKEEPAASQVEGRKRSRRKTATPISDDWQPNEHHFSAAGKLGVSRETVTSKAEDMRLWARSKDERKVDWDATFHGFIRRAKDDRRPMSGGHPARQQQPSFRQIHQQLSAEITDETTGIDPAESRLAGDGCLQFERDPSLL